MRIIDLVASASALAVSATAQTVSPAGFATKRGDTLLSQPFGEYPQFVYQQIHGDMRGKPMTIRSIAFRRFLASTHWVARNVTVELFAGEATLANATNSFATNFSRKVNVLPRRRVSLPAWTRLPPFFPANFDAVLPFSTPLTFTGRADLCWQANVYANDAPLRNNRVATYGIDAASTRNSASGKPSYFGLGCVATGQTRPMFLNMSVTTTRQPSQVSIHAFFSHGRGSSPAVIFFSPRNANLSVPGLCGKLLVDISNPVMVTGRTTANGYFQSGIIKVADDPTWRGAPLYVQGATADPGRAGLPFAVSNRALVLVPPAPQPQPLARVVAFNTATATRGALARGIGLITQFR